MNRSARQQTRRTPFLVSWLGLGVLLWPIVGSLVYGYAPIDDLVASVAQMDQSGEIADSAVAADLTVRLQTIGALLDGGDTATARSLLADFSDTVQGLSGTSVTPAAATQLASGAQSIASGL